MLRVELPLTPSFNELFRMHWSKKSRLRKGYEKHILAAPGYRNWRDDHTDPLLCRVDVLRRAKGVEPDPDNLVASVKLILDALVNMRVILDDSPDHIRLNVAWEREKGDKKKGVFVTVSEIR